MDGLILFRWDAPLFFANAELFREQIEEAVMTASTPTRWVVVAAEPMTEVDMTAADMLAGLIDSPAGTVSDSGSPSSRTPSRTTWNDMAWWKPWVRRRSSRRSDPR